ncbi:MAG: hypothetical protein U5L00_07545 [Desulfovermiculus sp.]|nr:hypothetical protein [Desulfovermiculus sp.]
MDKIIQRFSSLVKGSISGFDRIVFKGLIRPLMSAKEVMKFCAAKGILNKNYKQWMTDQSASLNQAAEQYAKTHCGHGVTHINTWKIRKEELARERQREEHIENGLIGVWSCLESAHSYRAQFCSNSGYPQLKSYQTRYKHLYFYFDHLKYGFMNIRLQTWFPYHVQICLNGREWLRRSLEKNGIDFLAKGNKFLHIADYEEAQRLLDTQLDARFVDLLDEFLPIVFPMMSDILGPYLSYYWTMWQSEWATDLIFTSPKELNSIADSLLRHAHMTGTSANVLRYLDRPLTLSGKPDSRSKDQVCSRVQDFNDGVRVRHWVDQNSVKVYNEQNNLRIETTINNPKQFKVHRHPEGCPKDEPKKRLSLRKGVMDIPLRAKVSQDVNNRFMDNLSTFSDEIPARDLIDEVISFRTENGRRFRALDPTGKDRDLLQAIADPKIRISGLTNKMLLSTLSEKTFGSRRTQKQLSAKISRHLRLLRAHGIIRKLPKQNRYQLTLKGIRLTTVLNAFLAASTEKLMEMAA